jgi:aspartyl-tRNA(Asn)/glutamyl-tRNA(Gln) amidotransferase subunit B
MLVPTIGIEVHVELKSKSKVFSSSLNDFHSEANSNVNVIDLGYPGVLPKLNKKVVDMAMMAALALNCKINKEMHFDRKNYFYPDLPKGYQITQSKTPIGYEGYVEIEVDGKKKKIGIERIHIEEDTCKSLHTSDGTLLNFNRAGVPLVEIVSKPDIENEKEAMAYLETLREILLYLKISDVKIEEGSMRCDANVSLKEKDSEKLGTKTEIKNIGSISNVGTSILYEIDRQKEIIASGGLIREETRRFDDKTNTTVLMRVKETGNDYRYFPEPDLPYIHISDEWINKTRDNMPVLPNVLREKYSSLGINENNIKTIIANTELSEFLESIIDKVNPIIATNLLTGDILSYLNKNNLSLLNIKLNEENFSELIKMLEDKKISSKQSKDIIPILINDGGSVSKIISSLGIEQINDESLLLGIVTKVIGDNPESVDDYKAGKDRAVKYLMGQIMKESKGQANPQNVNKMLIEELKKL